MERDGHRLCFPQCAAKQPPSARHFPYGLAIAGASLHCDIKGLRRPPKAKAGGALAPGGRRGTPRLAGSLRRLSARSDVGPDTCSLLLLAEAIRHADAEDARIGQRAEKV
jgi:hypothetical protein